MNKNTIFVYDNGTRKITFSQSLNIWITSVEGLSENNVSLSETQSVGQIGNTITNIAVQPKTITINGIIKADMSQLRSNILACVLPNVYAKFTIIQNGESYYLEGTPIKTPVFSDGSFVQDFQFSFKAPFPYWRTTAESRENIAGLTALFKTPFYTGGSFYISQYSDSLYKNVFNYGDSPIEFDVIFEATALVLNPELYHINTNTFIRLNRQMIPGEKFEVSTVYGRKRATLINPDGTTENGFKWLDIDSNVNLALLAGDNLFRYSADTAREGLKVTLIAPKGVKSGV